MNAPTSATPPAPAWRKLLRSTLVTLGLAAAGGVFGYGLALTADLSGLLPELRLSGGEWAAALVLVLPVWFLLVLIHELGHLAGGALAGFKPALLIVGPLKLSFLGGRAQLGLNRSLNLGGGLASALPPSDRGLRRGMLLMVLGGPLASLLAGLLALALLQVTAGLAAAMAFLASIVSLAVFTLTLLPMRAGGFSTDGARVLMLLRGGPQAERWCASALMASAALAGALGTLDRAIVAGASALRDGSPDAVGSALMAYSYYLSRGEPQLAGEELDYAMEHVEALAAGVRPVVWLEGAYFSGLHRADPATARGLLEQTRGAALIEPYSRHRAQAAVLLAEGRLAEADAAARAGVEALQRARIGQAGVEDARLLRELQSVIVEAGAASGPGGE
jgi:hypothetical protein